VPFFLTLFALLSSRPPETAIVRPPPDCLILMGGGDVMRAGRLSGLLLLGAAAVIWGAPALSSDRLPEGFRGKCAPLAAAALDRWGSKGDWQRELPGPAEVSIHRTPSKEIGVWISVRKFQNGAIRAVRETLSLRTTLEWPEADCVPRMAAQPVRYRVPASELKNTFTDERLKKLLKETKTGLIYSWSPHMPLSAQSLAAVQKAARSLKVPLTLVLDPSADGRVATKFARSLEFPPQSTVRMQSLELLHRGMGEHYPSLLVYQKGEVLGRAFPGYKSVERYLAFVNSRMGPISTNGGGSR
jgi:hypothetical protein